MNVAIVLTTSCLVLASTFAPAGAALLGVPALELAIPLGGVGVDFVENRCADGQNDNPFWVLCSASDAHSSCSAVGVFAVAQAFDDDGAGIFVSHARAEVWGNGGHGGHDNDEDSVAQTGTTVIQHVPLTDNVSLGVGAVGFGGAAIASCDVDSNQFPADEAGADNHGPGGPGVVRASVANGFVAAAASMGGAGAGNGSETEDGFPSEWIVGPYGVFIGAGMVQASLNEGCGLDEGRQGRGLPSHATRGLWLQVYDLQNEDENATPIVNRYGDIPANTGVSLGPFGHIMLNETSPLILELQDPATGAARCHRHVAAAHLTITDPVTGAVQADVYVNWVHLSVRSEIPQCRDTVDNDSDNDTDFPADGNCANADDVFEIPQPNLVVDQVFVDPATPNLGDAVALKARICNAGDASASGGFATEFRLDDGSMFQSGSQVPALAPGECVEDGTGFGTHDGMLGAWTLTVSVDIFDSVLESDENDNEGQHVFTVTAPDLVVSDVQFVPDQPNAGDEVYVLVTVQNEGNGPAAGSMVRVNGPGFGYESALQALSPGQSVQFATPSWTAWPGPLGIGVDIDAYGQVWESAEWNNGYGEPFYITAPDLIVAAIEIQPSTPNAGDLVSFRVKVENVGDGPAGPSALDVWGPGLFETAILPSLASGASVEFVTGSVPVPPGGNWASAQVNPGCPVQEWDCGNNWRNEQFHVTSANLVIAEIQSLQDTPSPGLITFRLVVANNGDGNAAPSTTYLQIDGGSFGQGFATPTIAPGGSVEFFSAPYVLGTGWHVARGIADNQGNVWEWNEGDNLFDIFVYSP